MLFKRAFGLDGPLARLQSATKIQELVYKKKNFIGKWSE
ncbi:hypothetical protein HAL07_03200 [Helicobacter ailurogastricus]|uniref:Uncharacterized protein n=1 Tax=Helicobacter ailurogastricus TaxID=1578720 RepID=A0A0K2Y2X8_9HELI|nr:hypothetical protein HAL07_03200 [Helicobacter ailurogastricus]